MASSAADEYHDVVIIGAGVSGLRCAQQLQQEHGVADVLIVEAQDRVGGRIMADTDFIPGMTVEIGAELLHGANTSLTKLAEEQQWALREIFTWAQGDGGPTEMAPDGGIGYYYLGDQKRMLAYDDPDPAFCAFNEAVAQLSELDSEAVDAIPPQDSMRDYFTRCQLSDSMLKLADAGYANTAGSRLEDISLRVTCRYERQWIELEDEGDYRVVPSFARVIKFLARDVAVKTAWAVAHVDHHGDDRITVTNTTGQRVSCRRLVVTVPTSVFLDISYSPPLSSLKTEAVQSFGMRRAAKVLLHFTARFWPANTHGVICSESFLPEFWVNNSNGVGHLLAHGDETVLNDGNVPDDDVQYLVTGFAGAECADVLAKLPEEEIITRFLAQLDTVYGTAERATPASDCFMRGKYFDWGNVEYVKGGYSFPLVGQTDDAAKNLADSIDDRIFFAGEATSYEQPGMSVHSAMDTGTRAARQVASSLTI